ncbi:unnamed protein product, partial [Amoebophrya sp. A25]
QQEYDDRVPLYQQQLVMQQQHFGVVPQGHLVAGAQKKQLVRAGGEHGRHQYPRAVRNPNVLDRRRQRNSAHGGDALSS